MGAEHLLGQHVAHRLGVRVHLCVWVCVCARARARGIVRAELCVCLYDEVGETSERGHPRQGVASKQ